MAVPRRRIPGLEQEVASIVMIEQKGRVAHYSKLEHVANILHDKKLLVGPVCNFADPREASLGGLEPEGIGCGPDSDKWWAAGEMICKAGRQFRLLCTAAPKENVPGNSRTEEAIYGRPRMWAQYGNESRGICVVLNREALNNELKMVAERDEYLMSDKVEYFPRLETVGGNPTIPYGPDLDPRDMDIFELMNKNSMLRSIYFKKSIEVVVLGSQFPEHQVSQVKAYCQEIGSPCFQLQYLHPKYKELLIYKPSKPENGP